jgi:Tfp pilus assembly protein PilF
MKRWFYFAVFCAIANGGCQALPSLNMPSMSVPKMEFPQFAAMTAPVTSDQPVAAPDLPKQDDVKLQLHMAREFEKHGRDKEATLFYEKVRTLEPRATNISWKLGVLYARQEEFEKSLAEFKLAYDADPKNSDLQNDIGYTCYQCGRWKEAEDWFRKALETNPKNTRAQVNLGLAVGQQGRFQDAFNFFQTVIGEASAYHNIGMLYLAQGHRDEAKASFRQALTIDPNLALSKAALDKLENPGPIASKQAPPANNATPPAPPATTPTAATAELGPPQWQPPASGEPKNFTPRQGNRIIRLSAPIPVTTLNTPEVSAALKKPLLGAPVMVNQ